jgi:anti-sigma factor RsiW
MLGRHVSRELSAYRQNELSPARAARVAEHLRCCAACRAELDEVSFGIRLAEKLPRAPAPEAMWSSIADALATVRTVSRPGRQRAWRLAVAAVAVVAFAAALAWYVGLRHPLDLHRAAAGPSEFELAAIAAHERRTPGEAGWELRTSDIARLRSWVSASSDLTADDIPVRRPPEDAGHLRVVGARLARVGSATAAVIGYEIDSQPVTLATARIDDLPDPPAEGVFSKNVSYRIDSAHGFRVLTWGVGRHAYVMVSGRVDLKGCYLCHTTAERRRLIDGAMLGGN